MTNQDKYVRNLFDALKATPVLSREDALEQLPDLVMADLAGEAVDTVFKDLLDALDYYPELAVRYASMMAEMRSLIGEQAEAAPARALAPAGRLRSSLIAPGVMLRRLRDDATGFLVQLFSIQPPPRPVSAALSAGGLQPFGGRLEDVPGGPHVSIKIDPVAQGQWQLEVFLKPRRGERWKVEASLYGRELRAIDSPTRASVRFEPVDRFPGDGLIIHWAPDAGEGG